METSGTGAVREDTGLSVQRVFVRELERGEALYREGDSGDLVYVVQSGQIELTRESLDGPRLLSRKGPGELLGEMDLLLASPRTANATAATTASVLELDAGTFEAMCTDRSEIAIRVIQRLASHAQGLEKRLAALGGDDLLRPLVRVLIRRARPNQAAGKPGGVANSLQELASESGLNLMETHRALAQLVDQRAVKLVEDRLEIVNLDVLVAAVEGPEEAAPSASP